jgi:hypothetical protein
MAEIRLHGIPFFLSSINFKKKLSTTPEEACVQVVRQHESIYLQRVALKLIKEWTRWRTSVLQGKQYT